MENVRESFEALKTILNETEEDLVKFENGNKAAGTRIRKAMMDVKNKAQEVRVGVQDIKKEMPVTHKEK